MQEGGVEQLDDLVEAGIESLEIEARTEGVVVADLVDLVVVDIQPLQRLRDEGEIEPLKRLKLLMTSRPEFYF